MILRFKKTRKNKKRTEVNGIGSRDHGIGGGDFFHLCSEQGNKSESSSSSFSPSLLPRSNQSLTALPGDGRVTHHLGRCDRFDHRIPRRRGSPSPWASTPSVPHANRQQPRFDRPTMTDRLRRHDPINHIIILIHF